jgi:glycosyltransferase A (GT-A) superfamily protein (DUF2064 family)
VDRQEKVLAMLAEDRPGVSGVRGVLGVFVRQPVPGQVKTRLAATLGPDAACDFYLACLADVIALAATFAEQARVELWIGFTPGTAAVQADLARLLPPLWPSESRTTALSVRWWPQPDASLGSRIEAFFIDALRPRQLSLAEQPQLGSQNAAVAAPTGSPATVPQHGIVSPGQLNAVDQIRVVLIGTDSPQLTQRPLHDAFAALETDDVVLGPAIDGGYYLIGARVTRLGWLEGVRWSSNDTFADTVQAIERQGWTWTATERSFDVDIMDDLRRLSQEYQQRRCDDPQRSWSATERWCRAHGDLWAS